MGKLGEGRIKLAAALIVRHQEVGGGKCYFHLFL
jgi:hypothetical protein